MPMTGTCNASVIALPRSAGMHSRSTMSAPADSRRFAVVYHLRRRILFPALHAKAAGFVHGLGPEAQVRAYGDIVPAMLS